MNTSPNLYARTHITALLVLLASALIVSAFAPSMIIPPEQTTSATLPRAEVNAPTANTLNGPTDPGEFEAFLNPLVAELMEANHIPGAGITVVKDRQIFFAKGYGYANLERGTLAVILCHLLNNINYAFVTPWFTGTAWVQLSWLFAGMWSLLALGLLVFVGPHTSRKPAMCAEFSLVGRQLEGK